MQHSTTGGGAKIVLSIESGDRIDDRFEIDRNLGEGLMSVVYAARMLPSAQPVALKFLVHGCFQRAPVLERVRREARTAAHLASEYACCVLDVRTLESGLSYVVMENVEGCTFEAELARRTRLPPLEALAYVLEACEPISEAHAAGLVHGDLKLTNLFLVGEDGSRHVKVMDFGLPNVLGESHAAQPILLQSPRALDSLAYKAPEQWDPARVIDPRADIWSLGVVLYELLTGQRPFGASSLPELVHAVLNEEPPAFSSMQLQVPNGLETVVRKALSKACEQRFESIAELAAALAPFAEPLVWRRLRFSSVNPSQTRWATHDGKTLPSPHSSTSAVGVSSVDEPAAPKAKRRGRVRIVGTLAALLAIVLVLLLRPARHKPAPRSTATLETATQPRATAEPRAPLPTSSPLPPESAGREAHGSGADSVPTPETTSVSSAKPSESASDAAAAPGTSTHELAPVVQRRLRPQAAPRPVPSEPAKQPATSVTEALRAPAKSAIELPDFGGRR